ncbi:YdcF family protein [Rhodobacter sp.]
MDSLFFIASKTLGMAVRVETWLVVLLALAVLAGARHRHRAALRLTGIALSLTACLAAFPLATPLLASLEGQYPANPQIPDRIDGIIVLGGAEDVGPYIRWGMIGLNDGAERVIAGAELARRFPQAKLVFTGGAQSLIHDDSTRHPSQMTRDLWLSLGIPADRILLEDQSRNTAENAAFTRALVVPQEGQVWLLVTSAFHMPRAMETFRRNGWTGITAWPVDFRAGSRTLRLEWRLDDHLSDVNVALKEHLGLLAYRVAGK